MEGDFEAFKSDLAKTIRQNGQVCKEGYKALLAALDYSALCVVIRKYWADLNGPLWPQFQALLHRHYDSCRSELEASHIYYNTFCSEGLCIVDRHCQHECLLVRGTADVVCHDDSRIKLMDQAVALLLDESMAVATEISSVDARQRSLVEALGYCTVRATDEAKVVSDGATQLYLYGQSQAKIIRYRRMESSPSVSILSPFTDFK